MRSRAKENEKPCAYCHRTFTKEEHLKRHERSHTGEKPFKCHKCNRRYGRSDVLARHLQTHPSEITKTARPNEFAGNGVNHISPKATEHRDQAPFRCAPNQPESGLLFLSEHRPIPLADHDHDQLPTPAIGFAQPATVLVTPVQPPEPSSLNNNELVGKGSFPAPEKYANGPGSQTSPALYSSISDPRGNIPHDSTYDSSRQPPDILAPFPNFDIEDSARLDSVASNGNIHARTDENAGAQPAGFQSSLEQMIRDQPAVLPMTNVNNVQDLSGQQQQEQHEQEQAQQLPSEVPALPTIDHMPLLTQLGSADIGLFIVDNDFNGYSSLSPGILDHFDFITPRTPGSTPPDVAKETGGKPDILFSDHQVQRMRPLWRGHRPGPGVRVSPSLWRSVVQHQADSIFSRPDPSENGRAEPNSGSHGICGWGIDETCRMAMIDFCKDLEREIYVDSLADFTPLSTSPESSSDAEHEQLMPVSSTDGFASIELIKASLDVFFQFVHLPFLHKATFDAQTVSMSLLLPIHFIGLSSLYPERSKQFVLRYLKVDLGSHSPSLHPGPEDLDECQAHMLCVQMLHVVEKHGIFAASDHDSLVSQLQVGPSDHQGSWKSWVRVESIKRMISCLLWMDMAYTRLMGSAGVVDIDRVELYQPCDDALFDAPTSAVFLELVKHGTQLMMPRVSFHTFYANPPATLNHFSIETFLVAWYLQIAAIRHRLPIGNYVPLEVRSHSPPDVFSESRKARDVIASLLMLPSSYPSLFQQRHRTCAFAWHNVNLSLTVDLDLLEIASGRDGPDLARTALMAVSKWAQTPGARRAALHAAQIFDILSSSRLKESNISRPDLLLFNSALVLSMYLFVSCREQGYCNAPPSSFFEMWIGRTLVRRVC
ncbi:uncharacterized protein N7482_000037 [Penicillium canariense]|uniref:C2H2-type domain-containing protein n=1 Tax=Penicillium canariense TaxID=189055 RepID=A0A9W9IDM9_9EURO|nr:uncharacterized protein N7482_000037 [Penicillium canariense]KAJ5174160.1 hypothetical protein N7482_000037 [Penicillium canariense]